MLLVRGVARHLRSEAYQNEIFDVFAGTFRRPPCAVGPKGVLGDVVFV